MTRRRLVAVAAAAVLAAGALVVDGAGTARRLADRQMRAAKDLLADASTSSAGRAPDGDGAARDPSPVPAGDVTPRPAVADDVVAVTNADRAAAGVAAVGRDPCMDAAASSWAQHMAETGRMVHAPDGEAAVRTCRGPRASWGDNIGHWQPCSASDMQRWWMSSPSHRPHVLDEGFVAVGVGVWAEPGGRCWFQVLFGS